MTRASQVRSWLRDVTEWRAALPDVTAALLGLHSPRPAPHRARGGDGRLPFRLDEVTDDLDDGAAGIRTSAGLGWLLDHWASPSTATVLAALIRRVRGRPTWASLARPPT